MKISERARLLVEAGERARKAKQVVQFGPSDSVLAFLDRARNDSPDIATALIEAAPLLRELVGWVDENDYSYFVDLAERARAWLAKWEGDASDPTRAA